MKKLLVKYSLSLLLICGGAHYVTGCASTPVANINNANALLITSVNTGMTTWAAYVQGGNTTQSQVDDVRNAYNLYYNIETTLKSYLIQAVNSTNTTTVSTTDLSNMQASSAQAEASLLSLLNKYLLKK